MTKVATSKISPQWSTTIPSEVRPWLKAGKGEELDWIVQNGDVLLRKKKMAVVKAVRKPEAVVKAVRKKQEQ